jgi:hypothetical protein
MMPSKASSLIKDEIHNHPQKAQQKPQRESKGNLSKKSVFGMKILPSLLLLVFICTNASAQSIAETLDAARQELDAIQSEFVSCLESTISNAEKLQNGKTKIDCENMQARLEQLNSRINEAIKILAKREADLANKSNFTEAERLEFTQTFQSQKQALEAVKKQAWNLKIKLKSLVDKEIDEIHKVYDYALEISGQDAKATLESRINAIINLNSRTTVENQSEQPLPHPYQESISTPHSPRIGAVPSWMVCQGFSDLLRECEESLNSKSLDTNILKKILQLQIALEKSQEMVKQPYFKIRMLSSIKSVRKIFEDISFSIRQKKTISDKKGLLDTQNSFEQRNERFASNAERTIQTKFESGALSLSRLIADWDAFTLRQNSSVFFQRDSFVDLLLEDPKQTAVE